MKMFLISDNIDTLTGMRLAGVEGAVVHERDELKEALKGTDIEAIKAKQEEVQKAFYAISEELYKNAQDSGAAGAPGADAGNAGNTGKPDDGVVDADFKEV